MKKIVYILRGVPGCGKSTLARELAEDKDWLIFEADKFHYVDGAYQWKPENVKFAHDQTYNRFAGYVAEEISPLVVSNTNTTAKEFKRYFDLAKENGYQVFVLVVENRHDGKNTHNVPEETLVRMEQNIRNSLKLR